MEPGIAFRVNEPHVVCELFDQELVAVHLTTGAYHSLSGTARDVLLLLGSGGATVADVVAELSTKYDATPDVIRRDLEAFLAQLQEQLLIAPAALDTPRSERTASEHQPTRAPYVAPVLESFSDLQELFLLDPVHDVGAAGWPSAGDTLRNGPDGLGLPLMRCRLAGTHIIFESFDDETVAMNLGTGAYHTLTGPAEDIFLLFPHEPTTWEIRNALATKYASEVPELESAVRDHLAELTGMGLIVVDAVEPPVPERQLPLRRAGQGVPFTAPTLSVFYDASIERNQTTQEIPTPSPHDHLGAVDADVPRRSLEYALRPGDLLMSAAGGEIVICDRDTGCYFKLNEAATIALQVLLRERSIDEVVVALLRQYMVSERELRGAVTILLSHLKRLGLIVPAPGTPAAPQSPNSSAGEPRMPFPGFDVAMHRDLEELMRPFNLHPESRPKPRPSQVRHFSTLLEDYFLEAAEASGVVDATFAVADQTLRLRASGKGHFLPMQRALEHLSSTSSDANLTIHAWSCSDCPPPSILSHILERMYQNWEAICGPRGELVDFHGETLTAIYHPGPDILSVVDMNRGNAYYLARNDEPLPSWELSAPFRHILHRWFSTRGLQYTHAGAVGVAHGGVLFGGKGGSGKSTTSMLCAAAGLLYAGDDYCLTDPEQTHVFSLYNSAKLKGVEDLERLPLMRDRSVNPDSFERGGDGKGTFLLSELWPQQMVRGLPLRAILLPVVTDDRDTRLEPCSPSEALLALAPSTLAQLPGAGQTDADRLGALAERLPAYRLLLGADLEQIPSIVRQVLE